MTLTTKGRCPLCHEAVNVAYDVKFCVIDGEQQYRYAMIGKYQHERCVEVVARERILRSANNPGSGLMRDSAILRRPASPERFQHIN